MRMRSYFERNKKTRSTRDLSKQEQSVMHAEAFLQPESDQEFAEHSEDMNFDLMTPELKA